MKKYNLFFLAIFAFIFTQDINAQDLDPTGKSVTGRQQIHDQTLLQQHDATLIQNMQNVVFRFETAFEEQDLESTKVLQNDLVDLMVKATKAEQNLVSQKQQNAIIEKFAAYKFAFNRKETSADVKHKGMPSQFLKLISK